MLISLLTDRNEMYKTVQYIGRVHARVVKETKARGRAPLTRNCGEIQRTGWNFSRFLTSGLSDKLHFRAGIRGVSRVNSRRLSNSMEITWLPCGRPDRHRDYLQSRIESRTAFGNRRGI